MTLPPAVILCGGLATRLGNLTKQTPKSMLPVLGKPFIYWQLINLQQQGVRDVILCTGHLDAPIREYVGNGRHHGLRVSYSHEQVPQGTAGGIRKALPLLPDTFFVTYGDSYLDTSWENVYSQFISAAKPGLLTAYHNNSKWDTSNIRLESGEIRYIAEPSKKDQCKYIDYGLLVMTRKLMQLDTKARDLKHVLAALSCDNLLSCHVVKEQFYEIGSLPGINRLEEHLLGK